MVEFHGTIAARALFNCPRRGTLGMFSVEQTNEAVANGPSKTLGLAKF